MMYETDHLNATNRLRRDHVAAKNDRRLSLTHRALLCGLIPLGLLATPDASWGARADPISQIAPLALPELAVLIALADLGRLDPDRTAIYLALLDEMVASADVEGLAAVAAAVGRLK